MLGTAQLQANKSSDFFCFCFHEEYCTYFKCMPSVKLICFRSRNGNYRCQEIGSILMIETLGFLESLWWTALPYNDFALQNYPLYNNTSLSSISERWPWKFKLKNPQQTSPKHFFEILNLMELPFKQRQRAVRNGYSNCRHFTLHAVTLACWELGFFPCIIVLRQVRRAQWSDQLFSIFLSPELHIVERLSWHSLCILLPWCFKRPYHL